MSDRVKRAPLGRGLAALFGDAGARVEAEPGAPRTVPIETIRPSPLQPRRHFVEAELDALAQSIREKGIVQPLLVRPIEESEADFELVAGERRWRAAQRVGLHQVPVVIRQLGDVEALEIALVANLQREDLSPLDEAGAYSRLQRDFGRSQAEIAGAVGRSRSHITNTVRLLLLPKSVRRLLDEGALSAGHARALLAAPDPAALAEEVVRRGYSVRFTEELVRRRATQPVPRASQRQDADTVALERELSETLGLRVTLSPTARGGSLTLHYRNLDQLDRILRLLRRD